MKKENENDAEQEELDFDKPDYLFTPSGNHDWRQQGPYIVCKSCELEHAVFISMNKRLIGIDEKGQPILTVIG